MCTSRPRFSFFLNASVAMWICQERQWLWYCVSILSLSIQLKRKFLVLFLFHFEMGACSAVYRLAGNWAILLPPPLSLWVLRFCARAITPSHNFFFFFLKSNFRSEPIEQKIQISQDIPNPPLMSVWPMCSFLKLNFLRYVTLALLEITSDVGHFQAFQCI